MRAIRNSLRAALQVFSARRRIIGSISVSGTSCSKGVLGRYGLCRPVRNDFALVDSPGEFVKTNAVTAEAAFEHRQMHLSQFRDRLYLKALQLFLRNLADSGQTAHQQRQQEGINLFRLDDEEPVRFSPESGVVFFSTLYRGKLLTQFVSAGRTPTSSGIGIGQPKKRHYETWIVPLGDTVKH